MPDIFDEVAAPAAPASQGDIFDQVAAKPSDNVAPAAPPPNIDYAHPAGATAPLGAPAAHPQLPLELDPSLEGNIEQRSMDYNPAADVAKTAYGAGKEFVSGAGDVYQGTKDDLARTHGNPFSDVPAGEDAAANLTGRKQDLDKIFGGTAKMVSGGGMATAIIGAPEVLGMASTALSATAPVAARTAAALGLSKIVAGVGAGTGASIVGGKEADKYHLDPGAKNLVQAVSFFVPSLMGLMAGVKTDIRPDIEGNPAASVEAFGGKVKAGGVATPDSFKGAVKVGDTRVGVNIPRGPAPAPPDPASVLNAEQADAGTNAIVRAATKAQQAAQVVAGGPPPPPPGPPMPDGMKDGVISPEVVQNIAAAINTAPPEQHPKLLMEAHGKLTEYIQKQGRIIGPDGKLQIAETPQAAAKLAQNIINTEVDRQHQAKADAEKAKADAVAQAAKDATTPGEDGKLSPADQQWQRAKTIIDSTTLQPKQTMEQVLQRNLNVGPQTAQEMVQRHANETAQVSIPTIGSKAEPVVEESRATVDAQLGALSRGDIKAVMLPEGSRYIPKLPEGMKMMSVDGDAPGAGKYIYDPKQIKAATIKEAAKAGTHGDILGHVQSKDELAASPEKPTVVVQAQEKDGTPIQDSEVHPERVPHQVEAMQERHPGAKVSVKPTEEVIGDRLAAQESESEGHKVTPLTRDEALASLEKSYANGKHKESDTPEEIGRHIEWLRKQGVPQGDYIQTRLPLSDLDAIQENPEREKMYANQKGEFPPVSGRYGKQSVKNESKTVAVVDGNHRVGAARLRGDKDISVIMPKEHYEDFLKTKAKGDIFDEVAKPKTEPAESAPAKDVAAKPTDKEGGRGESPEPVKGGGKQPSAPEPKEHKYDFGNVQHNIEDASPAAKALDTMRAKIKDSDLAGDGKDIGENHVTVRYGLKEKASPELKAFIRSLPPFEAKLGKVTSFPPHADAEEADAAPLIASVESPELHRINGEIDKHDDFEPSSFPDYKPHATIAYVKPDAVSKYVGDKSTEGATFMVRSIAVGDRDGNHEEIALGGKELSPAERHIANVPEPKKFPALDTNRGVTKAVSITDDLLVRRAMEKAKDAVAKLGNNIIRNAANPDNFMLTQIKGMNPKNLSPADRDSLNLYLFGDGGPGTHPGDGHYADELLAPENQPLKKGDLVTAKDLKGKERTGKVAFTDGKITRIKTAADKEITVKASTVKRAIDHSKKEVPQTPLDKFEAEGKEPWQITQKEWTDLQRSHRAALGQSEESGTQYAPYADYEEFHQQAVKDAIAKGEDVPFRVRANYGLSPTPEEGRQGGDPLPDDVHEDEIRDVIRWSTMPNVGLRMVADDYPEIQAGDVLQPSHDWVIGIKGWGPDPETRMDGTSAIRVSRDDGYSENRQNIESVKGYDGGRLVVIESEEARPGRDWGEIVMKSPQVLAVWGTKPAQEPKPAAPKSTPQVAPLKGMSPLGATPEARTYQAEVSKFAGDPKPRMETIQAENRRDAEAKLQEKFPGQRVASAERVEKPVAQTPTEEENKPDEPGDAETRGRRETSDSGSGDRAPLAERPTEVLRTPDKGERPETASPADSPDVRDRIAAVPIKGSAPGSGKGSDTGIDSAPGLVETEKATAALNKVVKLNPHWFSHPADFSVPSGEMGKLDANLKALRILRDVEANPRKLSSDDKMALAQFAGWGSLSKIFNPYTIRDHQQQMRYREAATELRKLLSPDEMAAAERSTMNAHYTSPEVVRWMWDVAKRLGFKGGTVLEPSMGSGNFFGMMPKAVRAAVSAIGNELDPLTASIAKQLYPGAQIYNKDFVDLIMADNSVDFAIGNVPFGVKIHDPKYPKLKAQIHDYFFIKSLDKVRPGGIVSYITSTGSMDKIDTNIRELLASRADLVAAFRLPSGAFKAAAGTDVTTDLMIFRKRAPGEPYKGEKFVQSVEMRVPTEDGRFVPLRVSEYFANHPDDMLGVPVASKNMYGSEKFELNPHPDKNMKDLLDAALRRVPVGNMDIQNQGSKQADTPAAYAPDNIQEGQFVIEKGKLMQRAQGRLIPPPSVVDKFGVPSLSKMRRIKDMVGLRDKLNALLAEQKVAPNDPEANAKIQKMADGLKKDYDAFVKTNGLLNAPANNAFEDDPHYPRLLALENYDKATKKSVPADIFTKRTIFPRESLANISPDPQEALQQILGESGFPDVALIAQLQGKKTAEVAKELLDRNLVYQDPLSGKYEMPTSYLSGYVRDKLADAQAAVDQGLKQFQRNVDALTKALPPTIPIKEINIRLGQTWIPSDAIEEFIQDVMNTRGKVTNVGGVWKVEIGSSTAETTTLYGTPKRYANELMEDSLNQKQTSVRTPPDSDGKTTLDVDATNAARAMQVKIAQAFTTYAVEHPTYGPQFEKLYNYAYNNLVRAEHDGSHLTFPGMVKEMKGKPFQLQAHQANVAWQFLQDGRGFAAHTVGAGKTFATIASIMESRRLGLGKKHMVAVPNHLVSQWRHEWMQLYPGATLLVPTKDDFNAKNRNKIMAKIATGDFDAVILPHSQFNLMDISPERQEKTMQGEMDELNETIRAMEQSEGKNSRTVKQMAKARENLRTKMAKLKDLKADKTINFDELGVDKLYVDEAHEYKNLSFYTKMQRVSGLGQSASKKGTRLLMKTQYLQDMNNGRGVHFLSGTPVQNTMAELYTQNKYVAPDVLQKAGIKFFDDWAANFGEAITNMELSADGRSYKARTKFAQFVNVPELMQMFRSFADVKMKDDLNLPTPKLKGGGQSIITVPASDDVDEYVKGLMERALAVSGLSRTLPKPDPTEDNMLKITSDGRKAATDMRLISPRYPDDPDSKINQAVEEIFRTHRETREDKLTQAVFLDMYRAFDGGGITADALSRAGISVVKKPRVRLNLYEDMRDKLIARGVPASEIAIITEAKTKEDKQRIFDRMNSGQLRILFGSTQKMGAGMNAQRKMIRLHNLDLPWRPGDLEQRIGRIERQGNENPEVEVSNYLTTKSFDAYMAQTLQTKASFIHQVIGGKYKGRTMIDAAGPQVMAMEEMKIAASGDPNVKKKFELERTLTQLQSLERSYESSRFSTRMRVSEASSDVARLNGRLAAVDAAAAKYAEARGEDGKGFQLDVDGQKFTDRETGFKYLETMPLPPGNFYLTMQGQGISVMRVEGRTFTKQEALRGFENGEDKLQYTLPYTGGQTFNSPQPTMASLGLSIESRLRALPDEPAEMRQSIKVTQDRAEKLKKFADEGKFDQADELKQVQAELDKVNKALGIGNDLDGNLALTTGVTAEADNTGETEDEAEDAEESNDSDIEKTNDDEEPPAKTGTTLRSSMFGLDLLAEFMGDQGKKLWEKEIEPHLPAAANTFKRAVTETTAVLYPRIGANEDALDSMFRSKGEREKARFMLERMEGGLEKFFDKMPEEGRLAFIDRYKLGVGQLDPNLQKIEDLMRAIDKASFDRAKDYKPSMTAKEDHYRVLWKTIPDPNGAHAGQAAKGGVGRGRRPFEGDKGFMKRATLDTISEGINYGGVPVSTNPWKMFTLAQSSIMQYITAQDHWRDLKGLGLRKFVKPGTPRPDGWVKLDDRIAKAFFPAASGEGMIHSGEWYLEPTAGRILNNYLSRDLVRENAIGNALMLAKNLSTAIELGLSPFHFGFETVEAIGSQFGLGVQRFWNNGVRLGQGAEAMKGLGEIATSIAAPVLTARAGGNMLKLVDNPTAFAKTKRGAAFLKQYPDAADILDQLFTGGYSWGMNPDYRFDPVKSMEQTLTDKNYGGAMLRLVPWINHVLMAPLFEHYIPRLKLGFALAQYSQQLAENHAALANGDTTRDKIARQVIDTAENRFGEMNFSNILWNNTFKSVAQFLFRSITWKLGNWRGLATAAGPEAYHAFVDPIKQMVDDAKTGTKRPFNERIPKLGMNQAWLLGMLATTAVVGTILAKVWTGKYPWELASEDREMSAGGAMLLEMTHPRTGQVDWHTGKPERISLPTGFKDFEHAYLHPREYARGSMSGTAGNFVDLLENRDFFNNYVYDPNAPLYQQTAEAVKYALPKPIAMQGLTDKHGGQDTQTKTLKFLGLSPTSRERDLSPAEERMQAIRRARQTPLTPKQVQQRQDEDAIVKTPTVRSMHMALKKGHQDYIAREFNQMSYADAREVYYHLASPAEQRTLKPLMDKKRMALLHRNPDAVRRADAQ